jgi:hypothetical protein
MHALTNNHPANAGHPPRPLSWRSGHPPHQKASIVTNRIKHLLGDETPKPKRARKAKPEPALLGDVGDTITTYLRIQGRTYELDIIRLPEGWAGLLDADLKAKGYLCHGKFSNGDAIYTKLVG